MPNTRHPTAEADHSRQLYESQLRLNGQLVTEITACREAYAEQAAELDDIRDRDRSAAAIAVAHNKLLDVWGERLSYLEDQFIASLQEAERLAPVEHTLADRRKSYLIERSAAQLARRMDPVTK